MFYKKRTPYLFLIPVLIPFIIFFCIPLFSALYYSLTKWNLFNEPEFVGLNNYKTLLLNSDSVYYKAFWNGMGNTIKFVIFSVPPLVFVPFILAVLLNYKVKGSKLFQAIFYIPSLFSVATVALMWLWILDGEYGAVNKILGTSIAWSAEQPFVWYALVGMTVWWLVGINMVIYIAAINGVGESMFEAASIDGANEFQKIFFITIPTIKKQFMYIFVLTTISSFNVFGQPFLFSKGGPSESTKSVIMVIREYAFTGNPAAGMAVAMSVIVGVIIMFFSILQYFVVSRD